MFSKSLHWCAFILSLATSWCLQPLDHRLHVPDWKWEMKVRERNRWRERSRMGKLDQGVGDYGKAKDRGKEVDEKENEEREA